MIRLFALADTIDGSVLRAMLVAELIGAVAGFVFLLAVGLATRWWTKRKAARTTRVFVDSYCRHCPWCHECSEPNPDAEECARGAYCEACRARLHTVESTTTPRHSRGTPQ